MKTTLSRLAVPTLLAATAAGLGIATTGTDALAKTNTETETAATTTADHAALYKVDNVHSSVVFKVKYFDVANFWGRFNEVSGSYSMDMDDLANSSLDITVKAESVDTNNEGRDKHLRNPDFFDARSHPEIRFVGKSFSQVDDDTVSVEGELTFRGKTTPMTVELDYFGSGPDAWGNTRSGFQGTFTVTRSKYGSTYGIDNNALADDVELTVAITGTK